MSKVNKQGLEGNPFGAFNVLKGEFKPLEDEEKVVVEDTDITTEDHIIDNDKVAEDEAKRLAAGDEALKKVIDAKLKVKAPVEGDEPGTSEDDEDEGEPDGSTESLIKVLAKDFYNEGVIDFDDSDKEFEDSKDGITKLVNKTVQNRINKFVESLPPDLNDLITFVQNGGKPKDFMDVYYTNRSWEDIDIEDENNQKLVVAESLRLSGESEEDINEMVDEWYDNGTLNKRAKSAKTKLIKHDTSEKERILVEQKAKSEFDKKNNEKLWNDAKNDLMKKEEIMGFKVTPKILEKLWDYVTAPDKRTGKTAYQEATETKKDSMWLFALQAMNNFDKTKLEIQTRTAVSKDMNTMLKNYVKTGKDKISSGRTDENYSGNPFEAFKNAK